MSEPVWVARCPAKINLGLRVLHRREDGFHELDTLFQAIELWDTLEATAADELGVSCDHPDVPEDESNLVLRAARLLRHRAGGRSPGARICLRKQIPVGGGLGGGSSNAAATLLLLRELWGLSVEHRELVEMAGELGSDVPFFLYGGRARGRGRGDRIEPLAFPGSIPLLLGVPPFGLCTRKVYEKLPRARLTLPANDVSLGGPFSHNLRREKDLGFVVNDLEKVVFSDFPELAEFREALLKEGAACATLSGAGSAVFGLFESETRLGEARERLATRFRDWQMLASRTIGDSIRIERRAGVQGSEAREA